MNPATGPGSPFKHRAGSHPSHSRRCCLRSPKTLAQRNHRETKPGLRGLGAGEGTRRPGRSPGSPPPGEAASVRPSPKCFRTCHPPPAPFSPLYVETAPREEGARGRTGGRSSGWRAGPGAAGRPGSAAPRPLGRPPPPAAIVPA
uniref:Cuticle collagen 7-like n=1 Tax=Castor canadensis TaxID=51338 RepID=A0A8B7UKF8_CASCN|nr:cuticle collagen 7-like [Castor canadensis]